MRFLGSRRRRRRIVWTAVTLAVLGGVAGVLVLIGNTGRSVETPLSDRPAQVVREARSVPYRGARRAAAEALVRQFVRTAVLRRNVAASWDLAAPELRHGFTRATWAKGSIPVYPFPAKFFRSLALRLDYSHPDDLVLDAMVGAKSGSNLSAEVFTVELKGFDSSSDHRWRVVAWVPRTQFGAVGPSTGQVGSKPAQQRTPLPPRVRGRLSPIWFLVPGGVLALALIVPIGYLLVQRRRRR